MFEQTYSFRCDPSTQPTVSISKVTRQVVLDEVDVVVTLIGYYEAGSAEPKIAFIVQNNRQEAIRIESIMVKVNGKVLMTICYLAWRQSQVESPASTLVCSV
ncbi:MAG: hypothetical protein FWD45_05895 [Coriobacteriia bacterium]|nr:hypothetical protein [Coriobacteriia bacterium]